MVLTTDLCFDSLDTTMKTSKLTACSATSSRKCWASSWVVQLLRSATFPALLSCCTPLSSWPSSHLTLQNDQLHREMTFTDKMAASSGQLLTIHEIVGHSNSCLKVGLKLFPFFRVLGMILLTLGNLFLKLIALVDVKVQLVPRKKKLFQRSSTGEKTWTSGSYLSSSTFCSP